MKTWAKRPFQAGSYIGDINSYFLWLHLSLYFILYMLHKVLYNQVLKFAFQGYWVYVFVYMNHVVTCKQTSVWSAVIMWYPCVLTTCHISIMVTTKSFYDTYCYTVFHFTCRILKNCFFYPCYFFFFFSHGKFLPLLSPIIFPSIVVFLRCYICKSLLIIKDFINV